MKIVKISISFMLLFLLSYGVSTAQETILYAAASEECNAGPSPSTLYITNPATGASKAIGPIGFNNVTGLAILGDGRLVGSANADEGDTGISVLIEISRFTGQGSLIGIIGNNDNPGECGRVPDITYDPATDTLYGIARRCNLASDNPQFIRINQTTGQATIIGDVGFDRAAVALAIRDDGTIFLSSTRDPITILYTVNPLNGLATPIFTFPTDDFPIFSAFAFHPVNQELYGLDIGENRLETLLGIVDFGSEQFNSIGRVPDCSDALIFAKTIRRPIPTLSEWGLIAMAGILGIVGFIVIRRRNVTA